MTQNVKRNAIIKKSRARRYAMQCVYQYLLTQNDDIDNTRAEEHALAQKMIEDWLQRDDLNEFDVAFFSTLIENVLFFRGNLDLQLAQYASRALSHIGVVEHAVLLVALVEMTRESTPAKVIINEAIILAKQFGGEDSHKFINGILDKIHHQS